MRSLFWSRFEWRQFDWGVVVIVAVLCALGLATIYSIDLSRGPVLTYFPTQIVAAVLGLILIFIIGQVHVTVFQSAVNVVYLLAISLLIAVLKLGHNIRGTTGWFRIAGISFQPAEFAKVALILFLAAFIHRHSHRFDRPLFVLGSGIFAAVPAVLVMLQPNLGSAIIYLTLWFGMLCLTNIRKRMLLAIVLGACLLGVLGWTFFFKDYQKNRLLTFLHPNDVSCAETTCYNVRQSLIAIGSGQLMGRGLGFGSQSQLHFLPEAQTDFIFSVVAEELGFLGIAMVIILYGLLLFRLLRLVGRATNDFAAYTLAGIAILFFLQVLLNIGAASGVLPVTGLTLPFVSYGGSSLLMNFALIGIAESMAWGGTRGSNTLS